MILSEGIELYHASYKIVDTIDLEKCVPGKDFGSGFYLTTSYSQACRFVKTALAKAIKNGIQEVKPDTGFISIFKYTGFDQKGLSYFEFSGADEDWLHCVAAHRQTTILKDELLKWKNYDILAGKIANDATNQVLTAYMNGFYGEIGSYEADETAIKFLLPNNLSDQICFRTQKAVDTLQFQNYKTIKIEGR
ncbi:MAG: DUF3990 domain-containing protein [Treponema sp.]|nr:DUF3990 domain-containing protein [Treponema sp.]